MHLTLLKAKTSLLRLECVCIAVPVNYIRTKPNIGLPALWTRPFALLVVLFVGHIPKGQEMTEDEM